jgi:hypothetical protein
LQGAKERRREDLSFFSSLCLRALRHPKGGAPKHYKSQRAGLAFHFLIAQLNGERGISHEQT